MLEIYDFLLKTQHVNKESMFQDAEMLETFHAD